MFSPKSTAAGSAPQSVAAIRQWKLWAVEVTHNLYRSGNVTAAGLILQWVAAARRLRPVQASSPAPPRAAAAARPAGRFADAPAPRGNALPSVLMQHHSQLGLERSHSQRRRQFCTAGAHAPNPLRDYKHPGSRAPRRSINRLFKEKARLPQGTFKVSNNAVICSVCSIAMSVSPGADKRLPAADVTASA